MELLVCAAYGTYVGFACTWEAQGEKQFTKSLTNAELNFRYSEHIVLDKGEPLKTQSWKSTLE